MIRQYNIAVPAAYLILKKGKDILLMKRQGSGYYDNWYSVPAGHVEEGELPVDCLIRESKEEIGIKISKENISFAHAMYRTKHDPTGDRVDYFFVVKKWEGDPKICEPHKCDEIGWFKITSLPDKMMHHVRRVIRYIEKNSLYSEFGLEDIDDIPTK